LRQRFVLIFDVIDAAIAIIILTIADLISWSDIADTRAPFSCDALLLSLPTFADFAATGLGSIGAATIRQIFIDSTIAIIV
jgi:hypothetical protein